MAQRAIDHQHTPAFFVRGPSPFARLVFFAALSMTLMATDSRLQYLTEVRNGLATLIHPLQVIANIPSDIYNSTTTYFVTHNTLLAENQRLATQAVHHGVDLQRLQTLETENAHLRNLLNASQKSPQTAKLGEILHMGRDPFTHKIVVNLGQQDDVKEGQAVVDADGVIGQVTRVYPFSSEVTLITDKELAIPIQVERNGLRAIAFGHGRDASIDLPYLPANVDIRKGDRLVTSGIDGIYPPGLAVAEVSKIDRNPNSPFADILGKPIAGIENHRQLLLIDPPKITSGAKPKKAAQSPEASPAPETSDAAR